MTAQSRPRKAISAYLIQDDNGQPLSQIALRSRFDKARTLAKVQFQFRDIRTKAATDTGDLAHSQKLLAHKNRDITEHYVKARLRERVKPLQAKNYCDRLGQSMQLQVLRTRRLGGLKNAFGIGFCLCVSTYQASKRTTIEIPNKYQASGVICKCPLAVQIVETP